MDNMTTPIGLLRARLAECEADAKALQHAIRILADNGNPGVDDGQHVRGVAGRRVWGGMTVADDDECAVKHCEEPATLGMTWRFGDVRIEFYVCERHFDEIEAVGPVGAPELWGASKGPGPADGPLPVRV